ncbi:hypothetical protein BY996DRAFT_6423374 [Phakopsora pachyrhizi]|nr:hypothetical protein BY996DRAFT_6423374 [Phakopsora pachyrhizi]
MEESASLMKGVSSEKSITKDATRARENPSKPDALQKSSVAIADPQPISGGKIKDPSIIPNHINTQKIIEPENKKKVTESFLDSVKYIYSYERTKNSIRLAACPAVHHVDSVTTEKFTPRLQTVQQFKKKSKLDPMSDVDSWKQRINSWKGRIRCQFKAQSETTQQIIIKTLRQALKSSSNIFRNIL